MLLRNDSNRLVGIGRRPKTSSRSARSVDVADHPGAPPVRVHGRRQLDLPYDPTLDPSDAKFQGQLSGLSSPQLAISVGGDRLVIGTSGGLQLVDTATHMVTGQTIPIQPHDRRRRAVPGTHLVAVGTSAGISVADIDTGMVQDAPGPSVNKITVGPAADGHMVAYGLVGRVIAPAGRGSLDDCTGTSSIVTADVSNPTAMQQMDLGQAVSDIAAAPDTAKLFATLPCIGEVDEVDGSMLTKVLSLDHAAVLAVADEQIFAAGVHPSTPQCVDDQGRTAEVHDAVDCTCTGRGAGTTSVLYARRARRSSCSRSRSAARRSSPTCRSAARRYRPGDLSGERAKVMHPLTVRPLDLVVLPGGQSVSIVTASEYYITDIVDSGVGIVIDPCLDATNGDRLSSISRAGRSRSACARSAT